MCARLLTYESAEEAPVLTSFFVGRSGLLENTTFALVAPDGTTLLTRAGRSPDSILRARGDDGAAELAALLTEQAKRYPTKPEALREAALLPYHVDLRRGLDAAACDLLPLVVVIGKDAAARAPLEKPLRPLVWDPTRAGRLLYAPAASVEELAKLSGVEGVDPKARLVVLQPDAFGLKGELLAQATDLGVAALTIALDEGIAKHQATTKDMRTHMAAGQRAGVDWKTEIPVTDPGANRGR